MKKERLVWADALKGWLIILVIIGHSIQTVLGADCNNSHAWNLIYSFHMPAFMAISGYFASNNKEGSWKKMVSNIFRRFQQLLVPYFIWSIILFIKDYSHTLSSFTQIITNPDKYFWFLWVLFFIAVIHSIIQWLSALLHYSYVTLALIIAFLLTIILVVIEFRLFGFQFIAYYFMFYFFGYCIRHYPRVQIDNSILLLLMAICWAVLAWFWKMHELPSWVPAIPHVPMPLVQYAYRGLTAVIAVIVLLSVSPQIMNSKKTFNSLLAEVGSLSLGLYVIHLTIIGDIVSRVRQMLPTAQTYIIECIVFVVTTVISYCVVKILKRYAITQKLLLGK